MKTQATKKRSNHVAANGSKWIRPDKRLAIYLRDGLACAYCGDSVEEGAKLSLDHLTCHSHGGSNNDNAQRAEAPPEKARLAQRLPGDQDENHAKDQGRDHVVVELPQPD